MKKKWLFLPVILMGLFVAINTACDEDALEDCELEEFCDGQNVTACCEVGGDCVYKYNGKEYAENELDQLASDLGCAKKGTLTYEAEFEDLKYRLEILMEMARYTIEK